MAPSASIISIVSTSFLLTIIFILYLNHDYIDKSLWNIKSIDSIDTTSSHRSLLTAKIIDNPFNAPNLMGNTAQMVTKLVEGTYDDVHVVFTTGCSGYQNWQSETLLYSWARVKHPGRITRIIAGHLLYILYISHPICARIIDFHFIYTHISRM